LRLAWFTLGKQSEPATPQEYRSFTSPNLGSAWSIGVEECLDPQGLQPRDGNEEGNINATRSDHHKFSNFL
jgi:hypothetical protein